MINNLNRGIVNCNTNLPTTTSTTLSQSETIVNCHYRAISPDFQTSFIAAFSIQFQNWFIQIYKMAEEENQFVKLVSAEGMEVRTVDLDGSNERCRIGLVSTDRGVDGLMNESVDSEVSLHNRISTISNEWIERMNRTNLISSYLISSNPIQNLYG